MESENKHGQLEIWPPGDSLSVNSIVLVKKCLQYKNSRRNLIWNKTMMKKSFLQFLTCHEWEIAGIIVFWVFNTSYINISVLLWHKCLGEETQRKQSSWRKYILSCIDGYIKFTKIMGTKNVCYPQTFFMTLNECISIKTINEKPTIGNIQWQPKRPVWKNVNGVDMWPNGDFTDICTMYIYK